MIYILLGLCPAFLTLSQMGWPEKITDFYGYLLIRIYYVGLHFVDNHPANTKHLYKMCKLLDHVYNVGRANFIHMFCVCRAPISCKIIQKRVHNVDLPFGS